MIHLKPVERHIHDRAHRRLCDGASAGAADISSEDIFELRDARRAATLCPACQDEVHPRDVKSDLYGMGRHSTAHLYSVPVLVGFDAVRNCSHCRRSTDDDCAAWRKLRKAVAVLRQECGGTRRAWTSCWARRVAGRRTLRWTQSIGQVAKRESHSYFIARVSLNLATSLS